MNKIRLVLMYVIVSGLSMFYIIILFGLSPISSRSKTKLIIHRSDPPNDRFTRCLLDAEKLFTNLSLSWFIAFGTALMYYRSNNFVSDDIDIGIFVDDFKIRNITNNDFIRTFRKNDFKLLAEYGNMTHGQGLIFACPRSAVHFGVSVFYHADPANNETFGWWTATYNGLCDKMRYRKCRWRFPKFYPVTFKMYDRYFQIVPKQFLVEHYGPRWIIPQKFSYFESLKLLPNLIREH